MTLGGWYRLWLLLSGLYLFVVIGFSTMYFPDQGDLSGPAIRKLLSPDGCGCSCRAYADYFERARATATCIKRSLIISTRPPSSMYVRGCQFRRHGVRPAWILAA